MTLVQAIADGTTPSQIEADPRLFQAVQSIACILESLGYAVFARMASFNSGGGWKEFLLKASLQNT